MLKENNFYDLEKARAEAEKMKEKKESGEANSYHEAERLIEIEKKEEIREKYKDFFENVKSTGIPFKLSEKGEDSFLNYYDPEQEMSWDNIAFVRSEKKFPTKKDGKLQVLTPHEESDVDRMTTHWTLNHKVLSHSYGSWEGNPYLIVCPGKDMVDLNGLPVNLYGIDTFWEKGIVLPENAVIISSGEVPEDIDKSVKILKIASSDEEQIALEILLEKMGYTKLRGGNHYLEWDKNVDSLIRTFAEENNIESGRHTHNWTESLESFLGGEISIDNLKNFFKNRGFSKIPEKIKSKLADKISEVALSDWEYDKSELFEFINSITQNDFSYRYGAGEEVSLKDQASFLELEKNKRIKSASEEIEKIKRMQSEFIFSLSENVLRNLLYNEFNKEYDLEIRNDNENREYLKDSILLPFRSKMLAICNNKEQAEKVEKMLDNSLVNDYEYIEKEGHLV